MRQPTGVSDAVNSTPVEVDDTTDGGAAFVRLADQHLEAAYRLAHAILRDPGPAQDATHDAFVQAWRTWSKLREAEHFIPWFDRILIRLCRDRLQRVSRFQPMNISSEVAAAASDPFGQANDRHLLGSAIASLSADHRVVVALRYYGDLSVEEIARRLNVPEGTVRARLHASLKHLRGARSLRRESVASMTDGELEQRLRGWCRLEIEADQGAPRALRASLAAIPSDSARPHQQVGSRRAMFIAATALAVAIVGGAVGVDSGLLHLPVTQPVPTPTSTHLTAAPTPVQSAPLAPTGYPGPGTIAFTRVDATHGTDATWLIDPDGRNEAPFRATTGRGSATALPGSGCCAVISPDGTSIAVGYDEVNPFRGPGTWATTEILNLNGTDLSSIPGFCGSCISMKGVNYVPRAWSADGGLLAIEVWNDADPTHDGINLAPTCSGACGEVPPLYTCADSGCIWDIRVTGTYRDIPVAFSPDGTELLFVRLTRGRLGTLMALTIRRQVAGGPEPPPGDVRRISPAGMLVFAGRDIGPAASWSPGGSRIAFAATDASADVQNMRVYVVASAGGSPIPLTAGESYFSTTMWSPDGAWIAFDRAIPDTDTHDLDIIRPDGTGETNLTADFDPSMCCARWSPDSKALLAVGTVADNEAALFIVPISGTQIYQVTVPGRYLDFTWGPASR